MVQIHLGHSSRLRTPPLPVTHAGVGTDVDTHRGPHSLTTLLVQPRVALVVAQVGAELSFDLDFHTIPFHGEDALVEKHYVSKRSRRQKGILAFLAQDGDKRFFCYANSDLRQEQHADEILQFVQFWKKRTGKLPEELIFDSKLTTHAN